MSCATRAGIVALLLASLPSPAQAQDSRSAARAGPRTLLPVAREIALARSAAPASVSDSAAIWVFTDTGYVLAETGTNGAACYVSRSWPASVEPHCFDPEGAATIMRIHMREVELLHRGVTPEQSDREIGAAVVAGTLQLPRRPVMSYMMSAGQSLIGDDGRAAGNWRPHVMIYYPYLPAAMIPSPAPDLRAGIVTESGKLTSSIMIVVPEFVQVRQAAPPR